MDKSKNPFLSVVVAIVSDTIEARCDSSHLVLCLEALNRQVNSPPTEIIVPYHFGVAGIDELKLRFSDVIFLPIDQLTSYTGQGGSREHHDELRARGLAVARGEIVALLEDHARPEVNWSARLVEAHKQRFAAVGGAIENGVDRLLNWAVYFCDFGKYQNPIEEGESLFASDANVSYKRSALETIRPVWQNIFHETEVNLALSARGQKLALSPHIIVYQHRTNLHLGSALKERFIWGRSYAATRAKLLTDANRMIHAAFSPALPALLLFRMTTNVIKKRHGVSAFVTAFPLTALLAVSWSLGELVGYVTAQANNSSAPHSGDAAGAGARP